VVVGICYIFIDHWNGIYGNEPYYLATSAISIVTVFLVRYGKYKLSTILSVSVMNFLIFLFSASDTYRSGVYIFFVANSLTAFALFGYKDREIALFFVVISKKQPIYQYKI
jgi:hypothetical protein